ncbi:phospholipase A1 PLIP2, chloroplastic-like [Aristolochia californica]|uniref:phospholipase A1 PLIP2, chloroplastic-like n=1 Tax=Aristolochia californica TaxID=171875 RepID=UPI0035E2AC96
MDSLCLSGAGICRITSSSGFPVGSGVDSRAHPAQVKAVGRGTASPSTSGSNSVSMESMVDPAMPYSFVRPFRYLWSAGEKRKDEFLIDEAVAREEAVYEIDKVEEEEEASSVGNRGGNWVLKILRIRSMWSDKKKSKKELLEEKEKEKEKKGGLVEEDSPPCSCCNEGDADGCRVSGDEDQVEFDRDSFSRFLRRVSLAEARLYARMSYLGNLAYSVHRIKPGNLLKNHGLRFVTSSLEKKAELSNLKKEKKSETIGTENDQGLAQLQTQKQGNEGKETEEISEVEKQKKLGYRISASAAYQIAAAAASYVQSQTRSIIPFKSLESKKVEDPVKDFNVSNNKERNHLTSSEVASFMATTSSVTAVVAGKEEMKQAVVKDLNSVHSSPCEWFICDDDNSATRFFAIQGSDSLASWQANLLFEPIQFEGLDVLVHRGIYEAARGIYEQMLPEVRAHLKSRGNSATFRFTGHSLGGCLALLVNLMLLKRGEVPRSSLLPVLTFGSPSVMCGGEQLLRILGLPQSHVQAVTMHRDIVPRAFSCNYPDHVAEILKAVNGNFRNHPCLNNHKLLYAPMGELLILQPEESLSPHHDLLPSGSGLYVLCDLTPNPAELSTRLRAAQTVFLNSPHPLEILSDPSAYGSDGAIYRDHDVKSYLLSIRNVIRQELNRMRRVKRERRRKLWWPLVAPQGVDAGIILGLRTETEQQRLTFSGLFESGKESLRRFSRLVASQHLHMLVVFMLPARFLVVGTLTLIRFF